LAKRVAIAAMPQHCEFSCKQEDRVFANVDASAGFISVHELSRGFLFDRNL
jgi:hypothetical protein